MEAVAECKNARNDTKSEQPSNLDCIDSNLWLGDLTSATDIGTLSEKRIKFILTINSFPLPEDVAGLSYITAKYINVSDTSKDDLLSHFDDTFNFIVNAVPKGAVLVHCFHGISRSPTIVMSYLMKKKKITMEAALSYIRTKRPSVSPNPDFLAQLKLYEIMDWNVDKNNVQYKMFRLYIAAEHMNKENVVPEFCADVIKVDPQLFAKNSDLILYSCKKCRRVLAQGSNEILHKQSEIYSWKDRKWTESMRKTETCRQFYFIEPLRWMENVTIFREGKLFCPNGRCKNKLGSFSWVAGCLCLCGTRVRPAFYLIPSKVDKVNKVNNFIPHYAMQSKK